MNCNFYFKSDHYEDLIIWDWSEDSQHKAWKWSKGSWKPKESDLVIKTQLPEDLFPKIKKELYEDIMASEHPKPTKNNRIKQY